MSEVGTSILEHVREAYRRVMDRAADAALRAGRRPEELRIIAVTKYANLDQIRALLELGHVELGESRVQQLQQRATQLEQENVRDVRWHMVGHLQRNKVKQVVSVVHLIHSIDSLRVAEELHHQALTHEQDIQILVQVNATGEESKFGLSVPAARLLIDQIGTMKRLKLRGLMTMAPHSDNPENARPTFSRTAELFYEIKDGKVAEDEFNLLSMGMTDDYPVAIEQGANLLRIGRAIVGQGPSS